MTLGRAVGADLDGFNEAAGIHRRKPGTHERIVSNLSGASMRPPEFTGGNAMILALAPSSVGIASMRPPEFTGGNLRDAVEMRCERIEASMRPPEFTGGNCCTTGPASARHRRRFNEAAGIHRRKPAFAAEGCVSGLIPASMRPPEFTGGNVLAGARDNYAAAEGFNEAAGIHRRKRRQNAGAATLMPGSFNEAAGIHRRKRMDTITTNAAEIVLQ